MDTLGMIGRLYWKELRQGWLVLLVGVAVPPLAALLQGREVKLLDMTPMTIALCLLALGLSVWAAAQGAGVQPRRTYAGVHFPIAESWPALVAMLTVLVVALAMGASAGFAATPLVHPEAAPSTPAYATLYFAALGLLSFTIGRGLSAPAGMVAGVGWLIPLGDLLNALEIRHGASYYYETYPLLLQGTALLGAFLAGLLLLPPRLSLTLRRMLAGVVLLLGVFTLPAAQAIELYLGRHDTPWYQYGGSVVSADGSLEASIRFTPYPRKGPSPFTFTDHRSGLWVQRTFTDPTLAIGFPDRGTLLLLTQRPGARSMTVMRWSMVGNSLTPVTTLPARRGAVEGLLRLYIDPMYPWAALHADGRYAVLLLPSAVGDPGSIADLWGIDLAHDRARLLQPAIYRYGTTVSWLDGAVVVASFDDQYQFDLTTGKRSAFHMPVAGEGRR